MTYEKFKEEILNALRNKLNDSITVNLVQRKAFKAWGIDTMTLHRYALANYNRLLPIEFINLKDYVREKIMSGAITGPDSKKILLSLSVPQSNNYLYLLSNKWAFAGAALISCKNVMDAIADFLGEDYYIIPSSVSEVLIIPESKTPSQEIWNLAIQEINESTLNPEEYLSDHTYFYSKSGKDSIPCFGEIPSPDPIQVLNNSI